MFQECLGDKQYKIRKFTVDFKLKVIKLIESNVSLHFISGKLKIDRKVLRIGDKKQSLMEVRNKNKKFRCNRNKCKNNFSDKQEEVIKIGLSNKELNIYQFQPKVLYALLEH